ncbi:glutamate-rich WD repeat-containing protein-like protein 1 [Pseudovirgaria hyperparasitica]|uniref:Glutamate-rich WD repeat-containing protein-like protein 1 n=1 Tax=Pseudovirgaria hyperparasitica TaxID=470096 RepID=A0A6A6WKZ2_9PEZI|nr:glutamate-rich WD repeat-containing protein-like protein 1 [Pseudovirgaria hyperparasitica]KAF2762833.1 glutamate-rich WD repeat-containing protein-like protein 1 [Pseudovirgaria hyperparasitica]
MSKRRAETAQEEREALKSGERPVAPENGNMQDGDFEDEYEDEFESEDEILEAGVDGRPDEEREAEEREDAMEVDQGTFIPGRSLLSVGETLAPDPSTYDMFHSLESPWPCLSCDIIKDSLGDNRTSFPATLYAVGGTQAESGREGENQLMVMKMSGLSRMDRNEEESDDEDSEDEADPILETKSIPLKSCTNRIRAHQAPQHSSAHPPTTLTASMTESGEVLIHDITAHLTSFDTPGTIITSQQNKPLHTIKNHGRTEGYAVDWSPVVAAGGLLTGDITGRIFSTKRTQTGFVTDSMPFTGHSGTVEEIQWSPRENKGFASAGNDGTIKVWDMRDKKHKPAFSAQASKTDINVLSWSHQTDYLLASGHDDGSWAVWDLRMFPNKTITQESAVASFDFHKEQITCVEWHPTDDSIVMVAAGDNTLTLWDLAVELDDEESRDTAGVADVPPQLLFVHYMDQVKEGHWHPQIPGCVMATGGSGFGVFKTISV